MGERRQVHRREPIECELDGGRVVIVKPLPWIERNDLGNEIVAQNVGNINDLVRMYTDEATQAPQMELQAGQTISDWSRLLDIAVPDDEIKDWGRLDFSVCVQIILAALEVNQLEHLKALVDPNLNPLPPTGGKSSSVEGMMEMITGLKTESSADSDSGDSVEPTPSSSPTES